MRNPLAIDPGLRTGFACGNKCWTLDLSEYDDEAAAHDIFCMSVCNYLYLGNADGILVERAFFGRIRNADFTAALIRMAHLEAFREGCPRDEMTADQWRRIIFGTARGHSDKKIVDEAKRLGYSPKTDHEANAALMLHAWRIREGMENANEAARSVAGTDQV